MFNKSKVIFGFPANDTLNIEQVGYNDFSEIKSSPAFRRQTFYTLHIVLGGEGVLSIGDKEYSLKEGDVFFVPPKADFMYAPKESNPWRYLWFIFHPDVLGLVKRAGFSVDNPVKRFNNFGVKSEYFDTFVNDCKYDFKSAVLAQSLFLYVLSEFTEGEFTNDSAQNIVDNSIRYIKNNYLDVDLKTTDISAALHINHSYLCKAFKSVKGCTIISFIKSFRLKKAVEMLVTTNQSIKEIVYSCGYNDYVYFCHEFKRVYGISASDYRKRHGESRSGFCC